MQRGWNLNKAPGLQGKACVMRLALGGISKRGGGKESIMWMMVGVEPPTAGRVTVAGVDVTGVPVGERNVAMVYQQFINYPSMKVAANIASPLKLRGEKNIEAR